jgi:hypothetical protein
MHVLILVFGSSLLLLVLRSMIRIALMNRHYRDFLAEFAGRGIYAVVSLRLRRGAHARGGDARTTHAVLLWFFPAFMLLLIFIYFAGAMIAFAMIYWGTGAVDTWRQALLASGSALNTLGFATPTTSIGEWLAVPEGALGLGIVVFLFTFIPGYQAVIRAREDKTSWLYFRAGDQPTGVALLEWCQRAGIVGNMRDVWETWEDWFRMLADTHSVLPVLTMSPSVQSGQSWVLAAAAVLDAAALTGSSAETADMESARICLRTGTRAFAAIAESLGRSCQVAGTQHACASREYYEAARHRLESAGVTLKSTDALESQCDEFLSLRARYEDALYFVARRTFTSLDEHLVSTREALPSQTR